jgi:urease beta subunit
VVLFDPVKPGLQPQAGEPVPGEIIAADADVELNAGRRRVTLEVFNTGDRAIQVRSHAHFFEANRALRFDREQAFIDRVLSRVVERVPVNTGPGGTGIAAWTAARSVAKALHPKRQRPSQQLELQSPDQC